MTDPADPAGTADTDRSADIPGSLTEITPSWLAAVLGDEAGPAPIDDIVVEPLGPGQGFLGDLARVRITWTGPEGGGDGRGGGGDDEPPDRPATVMVKVPPVDPGGRQVGSMLNVWAREQAFYTEVAPASPGAQVSHCHHAAADPDRQRWVLVLEDVPSEPLDTAAGATEPQVTAAVDALAAFHAHWWEAPTRFAWMPGFDATGVGGLAGAWSDAIPRFVERYGHLLPDGTAAWLAAAPAWLPSWSDRAATEPLTIVHADYRLDNLRHHDGRTTMLDWQTALRGPGPMDLSSLVVTGCTVADRRRWEADLLDRYGRALSAAGVDVDEVWLTRSYDENVLWWMGQFANNLARLEPDDATAQAALDTMIERTYTAAADREVGSVLTGR